MDFEAEFVEVEALLQHYDLEREFGELKDIPEDIFNTDDFEPQDLGGESRAAPGLHQVQVQVEVQVEVEVARLRARVQALEADNVEKEGAVSLLRSRVSNAERELAAAEARLSGEAARMKEEESRAVERLRREIEALKSEREAQEMEMQEMDRARQALNRALEAERKKGQRSSGVQEGKRKDIRLQESQLDEMEDQFLAFEKPRNMHKQVDVVGTGFSELDSESSAESSIRTKNLETEKKNSSPRASTGLRYSSVMDELCRITSRHFVLKCLEHIYSEVHRVQELKVVSQIFSTVLESELPVHYLLTPINKILQSDIDPSLCLIVLQLLQAICSSDYVSCSVILFGNPKTPPSSRKFSAFSSAHLIEPSEKMELEPLFANAAFRKSRFFFRRNNSASRTSIFLNERPADCRISRDEHYFDHLKISDLRIFRTLTSRITASPSEKEKEIAIASLEILKTCYVRFPPGIQDKELCVKFVEILEGSEIELKVLCLEVLHLLLKSNIVMFRLVAFEIF